MGRRMVCNWRRSCLQLLGVTVDTSTVPLQEGEHSVTLWICLFLSNSVLPSTAAGTTARNSHLIHPYRTDITVEKPTHLFLAALQETEIPYCKMELHITLTQLHDVRQEIRLTLFSA